MEFGRVAIVDVSHLLVASTVRCVRRGKQIMDAVKLALIKSKLNQLNSKLDKALDAGNHKLADRIETKMWRLSDKMDDLVCKMQYQ